jgi:Ca-activated chloride channel family protein
MEARYIVVAVVLLCAAQIAVLAAMQPIWRPAKKWRRALRRARHFVPATQPTAEPLSRLRRSIAATFLFLGLSCVQIFAIINLADTLRLTSEDDQFAGLAPGSPLFALVLPIAAATVIRRTKLPTWRSALLSILGWHYLVVVIVAATRALARPYGWTGRTVAPAGRVLGRALDKAFDVAEDVAVQLTSSLAAIASATLRTFASLLVWSWRRLAGFLGWSVVRAWRLSAGLAASSWRLVKPALLATLRGLAAAAHALLWLQAHSLRPARRWLAAYLLPRIRAAGRRVAISVANSGRSGASRFARLAIWLSRRAFELTHLAGALARSAAHATVAPLAWLFPRAIRLASEFGTFLATPASRAMRLAGAAARAIRLRTGQAGSAYLSFAVWILKLSGTVLWRVSSGIARFIFVIARLVGRSAWWPLAYLSTGLRWLMAQIGVRLFAPPARLSERSARLARALVIRSLPPLRTLVTWVAALLRQVAAWSFPRLAAAIARASAALSLAGGWVLVRLTRFAAWWFPRLGVALSRTLKALGVALQWLLPRLWAVAAWSLRVLRSFASWTLGRAWKGAAWLAARVLNTASWVLLLLWRVAVRAGGWFWFLVAWIQRRLLAPPARSVGRFARVVASQIFRVRRAAGWPFARLGWLLGSVTAGAIHLSKASRSLLTSLPGRLVATARGRTIPKRPGLISRRYFGLGVVIVLGLAISGIQLAFASRPSAIEVLLWTSSEKQNVLGPALERFDARNPTVEVGGKSYAVHARSVTVNSGQQYQDLVRKLSQGVDFPAADQGAPTVVSPSTSDWLRQVNLDTGRTVFDISNLRPIARTPVVIFTYREMAECLGWPERPVGWADIVALSESAEGWAACPKARVEWGPKPLVAFTDPTSSSTARSTLQILSVVGSGKPADQFAPADVQDPRVRDFVRRFQATVDHYYPDTLKLQTKMFQGPRFVHFAPVEEYILPWLYQGRVNAESVPGGKVEQRPITDFGYEPVAIYPKEGTVWHDNPFAIPDAPWVTLEQRAAAQVVGQYLWSEEVQREFLAWGFRPGTDLPYKDVLTARLGVNPEEPRALQGQLSGEAAKAVQASWEDVKKPGVAVIVIDTSGSMVQRQGFGPTRLDQAKEGAKRFLNTASPYTHVGLVAFSSKVQPLVPVGGLTKNHANLTQAVDSLQPGGETALNDAVKTGVEMADSYTGLSGEVIRGVVLLTDGQGNAGNVPLYQLIHVQNHQEQDVQPGVNGGPELKDYLGAGMALQTTHPIHIFSIGVGEADLEALRIFAEGSGGVVINGTTAGNDGFAKLLESFSKYF